MKKIKFIGVYWHNTKKAFVAMVNKNKGKQERLGYYNTELEAYKALMNYEVNIDD